MPFTIIYPLNILVKKLLNLYLHIFQKISQINNLMFKHVLLVKMYLPNIKTFIISLFCLFLRLKFNYITFHFSLSKVSILALDPLLQIHDLYFMNYYCKHITICISHTYILLNVICWVHISLLCIESFFLTCNVIVILLIITEV